ncbi:MAG TPA: cation-transporting P-type ATPase [Verrucomicrobiae bacterium]|nr:cation-transporting P-type ATPase [Verrucomicrobiae bacterium]
MDSKKIKTLTTDQLIAELHTSKDGLATSEASNRVQTYGQNILKNEAKKSTFGLLLKQFRSSLIYLLIAASILSFTLKDWNDGIVIAVILLINTGLGFYQEFRSEKAVEKLQKLVGKETMVLRDGKQVSVPEKCLVPGDVVILREGDIVPADVHLFNVDNLTVNESQLTGESVPVAKNTSGATALVYAGSTIEQGEAKGIVYATASTTELGKIAHLSSSTKRETQFEKSLSAFSNFLVRVTFLTLAVVFALKLFIVHDTSHIGSLLLFMIALSIAVVPEAMPVIVTVTLSRGALSLAKRHVIAKTLTAVEDLGNVSVLCSDKTGTLTENKQRITKLVADDPQLFQLLAIASLESTDEKRKRFQGSYDKAFREYIPADIQKIAVGYKRLEELPFDPGARRRRVVYTDGAKSFLVEVGSAETLLQLTKDHRTSNYMNIIREDGALGLRHLGIAYKEIEYTSSEEFDILKHEDGLHFVGFVALEDPLRPSAKRTVRLAQKLGVAIKILSGDSREVTQYAATQVGLMSEGQIVLTGEDIDKLSDSQLAEAAHKNNAFARLNPEQKYRIIKLLKLRGNVVGYQGDGINDAPSLKLADVAIAVNNATDVARESADILLLRSDIGVIVNGIRYGRAIFANINKYIRYTMIGNFGNFFALSALYLLSSNLPLLTTQLLLTNLLGDIPLVAIATDNVSEDELRQPSKYNMYSLIFASAMLGTYTALFEILFFVLVKGHTIGIVQTSLYLYLTVIGFVVILSVRNKEHFWKAPRFSTALTWAFSIIAVITIGVIYARPTQTIFTFTPLSIRMLGLILAMTGLYFVFLDVIKVWFYKATKRLDT